MRRDDLVPAVRERLVRLPAPHQAHYGVVPSPPPEEAVALGPATATHMKALSALAEADALARGLGDPYVVSRVLTRREAVSSSSIEGTHSTLDEILSIEDGAGEEAEAAARQVRSYALVLDRLVPEAQAQGYGLFTSRRLLDLHAAVMRDDPDYDDVPGTFRDRVVWIGGGHIAHSTWNPPPPDRVRECVASNVDFLRNEGMQQMTQSLLTRMAVAHVHFEAVHPFRDGNGRVGRLLLPLMMAADGRVPLYLSPFIEANKERYYAGLKAAQQRLEWHVMVEFICDAVISTVDELKATRHALAGLRTAWLGRRRFRAGSGALRALEHLPHHPVLTIKRLSDLLGISFRQAADAVDQLVQVGILRERTGYSRNRLYAAPEVLRIINRPFGVEAEVPRA